MEDKPWRKPGADMSDWFNYGFNEETWQAYSEKQNELRKQNQNRASIQVVETDRAASHTAGENHNASHAANPNAPSSFQSPVPSFGMNNMNMGMPGPQWMMGMSPGMGNQGMGPMGGMGMMKGMNIPGGLMTSESVSSQGDGGNEKDRNQGDSTRELSGQHAAPNLPNWNSEMGPMDLANRGGGMPHQDMYRMMGGAGPYNPENLVQMQMYGRGMPPGMRPPFHVFPGPPPAGAGRGQGGSWGQADARNQPGGQGGQERMDRERERERANERDRERDRERERDRDRKRGRDEESVRPREDEKRRKDEDRPRDDRPRDRDRERDRCLSLITRAQFSLLISRIVIETFLRDMHPMCH
jgi:pre-mRNA 3'-end-processing factor FIP1